MKTRFGQLRWRAQRSSVTATFLALALGMAASSSEAAIITYVTPGGSTQGGQPVNASATIATGTGIITVKLENLQSNPISVIQNLSDLLLTFSNSVGTFGLSGSSGQEVTVAAGGAFTLGATVATGWNLSSPLSNQLYLNVLGTAIGPAHTIIGPPGGPNYSAANGSIAGNGPHNPFLSQSASFTIAAAGVTDNTTVTGVVFSFGTAAGNDTPGSTVPEPGTLLLSGIGLGVLGLWQVRRRSATSV